MNPPASVPAAGKKMWRDAQKALAAAGTWDAQRDAATLERLVLNRIAAADALKAARAKPWVEGSTGQLVAHPGFGVAARCDQVALALARELQLTSKASPDATPPHRNPANAFEELDAEAEDELEKRRRRRKAS